MHADADAAQTKKEGRCCDRQEGDDDRWNKKAEESQGQDRTEKWRWRRDEMEQIEKRKEKEAAPEVLSTRTAKRSKGQPFAAALLKEEETRRGWRTILVKQKLLRTSYLLGGLPR